MRNLQMITMVVLSAVLWTGCVGLVTGHEYTKQDGVVLYKVIKKGVTTFMSVEDIEKARLDKIDILVTDTYKIAEGNDVPTALETTK